MHYTFEIVLIAFTNRYYRVVFFHGQTYRRRTRCIYIFYSITVQKRWYIILALSAQSIVFIEHRNSNNILYQYLYNNMPCARVSAWAVESILYVPTLPQTSVIALRFSTNNKLFPLDIGMFLVFATH